MQAENAVPVIIEWHRRRVRIEDAVSGGHINIAGSVYGGSSAARPYFVQAAIRSRVEDARGLGEIGGVVTKQPAVIGLCILVRGVRRIHSYGRERQARALMMFLRIEGDG